MCYSFDRNAELISLMISKNLSIFSHTLEALVVLSVSIGIAICFPEHKAEALTLAFTVLSALAKGIRVSDVCPMPDYVNPTKR